MPPSGRGRPRVRPRATYRRSWSPPTARGRRRWAARTRRRRPGRIYRVGRSTTGRGARTSAGRVVNPRRRGPPA